MFAGGSDDFAQLSVQLHNLNAGLKAAVARDDQVAVQGYRSQVLMIVNRMRMANIGATHDDNPSHAMAVLDQISDAALDTTRWTAGQVANLVDGAVGTVRAVPVLIGLALVVAAIYFWNGGRLPRVTP